MTNQEIIRSIDTLNALIRNLVSIQDTKIVNCKSIIDNALMKVEELISKIDANNP